jgi:hypothetical protein
MRHPNILHASIIYIVVDRSVLRMPFMRYSELPYTLESSDIVFSFLFQSRLNSVSWSWTHSLLDDHHHLGLLDSHHTRAVLDNLGVHLNLVFVLLVAELDCVRPLLTISRAPAVT